VFASVNFHGDPLAKVSQILEVQMHRPQVGAAGA
jgi:hypothetical protein